MHRPSNGEPFENDVRTKAHALRPICEAKRLAVIGNQSIVASITLLLGSRRPSTVFWRIATIIINAFNRVPRRWFTAHVGEKVFVARPALADGDAAFTIVSVLLVLGIIATLFHCDPDAPFSGVITSFGFTVREHSFASALAGKTSARFGSAFSQGVASGEVFFSAVAETKPIMTPVCCVAESDDGQASEALTCYIDLAHGRPPARWLVSSGGRALQRLAVAIIAHAYPKVGRPSMNYWIDPVLSLS